MMKKNVIVIAGKIGSGKDHVANLFAGYIGREGIYKESRTIDIVRFADPIKTGIAGMLGKGEGFLHNDDDKKAKSEFNVNGLSVSYGKLQQLYGDAMRDIDEDIFANILLNKLDYAKSGTIIIPDLRFENELFQLERFNRLSSDTRFIFIKLSGVYLDKKDDRNLKHQSEREVDKLPNDSFHYILNRKVYKDDTLKHMVRQILQQNKII